MTDVNAAAEPQQERSARHAFEAACTKIERAGGSVRNQRAVLDVVEDTSPPVYRALSFNFGDATVFVSVFIPDFDWQDPELHAFFASDNDDMHTLEAPCPDTPDVVLKAAYNLAVRKHAMLKKRAQAAAEPSALGRLTFNFGRRNQAAADAFYNDVKRVGYQVRRKDVGVPWVSVFIPESQAVFASVLKLAAPHRPELMTGSSSFTADEYTNKERLPRVWLAFKNTFTEHRGEYTSAAAEPKAEDTGSSEPLVRALWEQVKAHPLKLSSPVSPWKEIEIANNGGDFISVDFLGGVRNVDTKRIETPRDAFSFGLTEYHPPGTRKHFFDSNYRRTTPGDVHSLVIPMNVTTTTQLLKFLVRTCTDIVRKHPPELERLGLVEAATEPAPVTLPLPERFRQMCVDLRRRKPSWFRSPVSPWTQVRVYACNTEYALSQQIGVEFKGALVTRSDSRSFGFDRFFVRAKSNNTLHVTSVHRVSEKHIPVPRNITTTADLLRFVLGAVVDFAGKDPLSTSKDLFRKVGAAQAAAEPPVASWTWRRLRDYFANERPLYGGLHTTKLHLGDSDLYVGTPWTNEHVAAGHLVIGTDRRPGKGYELVFRGYSSTRGEMIEVVFTTPARGKRDLTSIPQSALEKAASPVEAMKILLTYKARGKPLISYLKETK